MVVRAEDTSPTAPNKRSRQLLFDNANGGDPQQHTSEASTGSDALPPPSFYCKYAVSQAKASGGSIVKDYRLRLERFTIEKMLKLVSNSYFRGLQLERHQPAGSDCDSRVDTPLFEYRRKYLRASFPTDPYAPVHVFTHVCCAVTMATSVRSVFTSIGQATGIVEYLCKSVVDTTLYGEHTPQAQAMGDRLGVYTEALRALDFVMWTVLHLPDMCARDLINSEDAFELLSSIETEVQHLNNALPHLYVTMTTYRGLSLNEYVYCVLDLKWRVVELILFLDQARASLDTTVVMATDERAGGGTGAAQEMCNGDVPQVLKEGVYRDVVMQLTRELLFVYMTSPAAVLGVWDNPKERPRPFPLVEVWAILLLAIGEQCTQPWHVITECLGEMVRGFTETKSRGTNKGKSKTCNWWVQNLRASQPTALTIEAAAQRCVHFVLTLVAISKGIAAPSHSRHYATGLVDVDWSVVAVLIPFLQKDIPYDQRTLQQHALLKEVLSTIRVLGEHNERPTLMSGGKDLLPKLGALFKDVRFVLSQYTPEHQHYKRLVVLHQKNFGLFMAILDGHFKPMTPTDAHDRLRKIATPLLRALPNRAVVNSRQKPGLSEQRHVTHTGLLAVNELVIRLAQVSPPSQLRNFSDRICGMVDIPKSDADAHQVISKSVLRLMRLPLAANCDVSTRTLAVKTMCDIFTLALSNVEETMTAGTPNMKHVVLLRRRVELCIKKLCVVIKGGDGRTFASQYIDHFNRVLTTGSLAVFRKLVLAALTSIIEHRRMSRMHAAVFGDSHTHGLVSSPYAEMEAILAAADQAEDDSAGDSFDPFGEDLDDALLQMDLSFDAQPTITDEVKQAWDAVDKEDMQTMHTNLTGVIESLSRATPMHKAAARLDLLAAYARCMAELYPALVERGLYRQADIFTLFGPRLLTDTLRKGSTQNIPLVYTGQLLQSWPSACALPEAMAVALWVMATFSDRTVVTRPILLPMCRQPYHPLYGHVSNYTDDTPNLTTHLLKDFCVRVRQLYDQSIAYGKLYHNGERRYHTQAKHIHTTLQEYFRFVAMAISGKKAKDSAAAQRSPQCLSLILLHCSKMLPNNDTVAFFSLALKSFQEQKGPPREKFVPLRRLLYCLHDSQRSNDLYYGRQVAAVVRAMDAFGSTEMSKLLCDAVQDIHLVGDDELQSDMSVIGAEAVAGIRRHLLTKLLEQSLVSGLQSLHQQLLQPPPPQHTTNPHRPVQSNRNHDNARGNHVHVLEFARECIVRHVVMRKHVGACRKDVRDGTRTQQPHTQGMGNNEDTQGKSHVQAGTNTHTDTDSIRGMNTNIDKRMRTNMHTDTEGRPGEQINARTAVGTRMGTPKPTTTIGDTRGSTHTTPSAALDSNRRNTSTRLQGHSATAPVADKTFDRGKPRTYFATDQGNATDLRSGDEQSATGRTINTDLQKRSSSSVESVRFSIRPRFAKDFKECLSTVVFVGSRHRGSLRNCLYVWFTSLVSELVDMCTCTATASLPSPAPSTDVRQAQIPGAPRIGILGPNAPILPQGDLGRAYDRAIVSALGWALDDLLDALSVKHLNLDAETQHTLDVFNTHAQAQVKTVVDSHRHITSITDVLSCKSTSESAPIILNLWEAALRLNGPVSNFAANVAPAIRKIVGQTNWTEKAMLEAQIARWNIPE